VRITSIVGVQLLMPRDKHARSHTSSGTPSNLLCVCRALAGAAASSTHLWLMSGFFFFFFLLALFLRLSA
jgi:hypothetical protein